jgi:Secretion system C-terminal sorting domain
MMFGAGDSECQYLVGDWDGDGDDELAVRRANLILMDFGNGGGPERVQAFGLGTADCAASLTAPNGAEDRTEQPVELKTTTGQLFLYPNPVSEVLTVALPDVPETPVQLRLFDLNGRLVLETTLAEQLGQLEVSSLQAGVYVLQMIGADGALTAVERVVKQ